LSYYVVFFDRLNPSEISFPVRGIKQFRFILFGIFLLRRLISPLFTVCQPLGVLLLLFFFFGNLVRRFFVSRLRFSLLPSVSSPCALPPRYRFLNPQALSISPGIRTSVFPHLFALFFRFVSADRMAFFFGLGRRYFGYPPIYQTGPFVILLGSPYLSDLFPAGLG